jgi:hypothetical protein
MKTSIQELVLGIPINSAAYQLDRSPKGYLPDPASECNILSLKGVSLNSKYVKNSSLLSFNASIN